LIFSGIQRFCKAHFRFHHHTFLRHADDHPSNGIILRKSKNAIVAEYAFRDTPIGVSEYRATASLPANLKGSFPAIEELEAELKDKSPQAEK
jgi:hypothetical protein